LRARSVRVSRTRFSTRGPKGQRGTVIRFRLRGRGRVELVVRANSTPCSILGRKRIRGHEGVNRVRFNGRMHGKPLAPGAYTITVVVVRAGTRTRVGTIGIEVVPNGRRLTRAQRTAPVAPAGCFALGTPYSSGTSILADLAAPLVTSAAAAVSDTKGEPKSTPPPATLGPSFTPPRLPVTDGNGGILGGWAGMLIYGAVAIAGAVLLVQVGRFVRGSWNP
jgi:hypothetical protein